MKRILTAAVISAGLILTACGVDKEGTADLFVSDMTDLLAEQGITITDEAAECLRNVVEGQSDETIEALADENFDSTSVADPELVAKVTAEIQACILPLLPTA